MGTKILTVPEEFRLVFEPRALFLRDLLNHHREHKVRWIRNFRPLPPPSLWSGHHHQFSYFSKNQINHAFVLQTSSFFGGKSASHDSN